MKKICILVLSLLCISSVVFAETDLKLSNEDIVFLTQKIQSVFPESIKNASFTINQAGWFTLKGNITSIGDIITLYNSLYDNMLFQDCRLTRLGDWNNMFTIVGSLTEDVKNKDKLTKGLKELGNKIKQLSKMPNDVVKEYYPNGQLMVEKNYKDYKLTGAVKFIYYYENGKLKGETNYKNNKLDGVTKRYYENGQLEEEINFKDGKMEGLRKEYDEDGILKSECNYKNNYLDGISTWYYSDGTIHLITYKDGKKIDEKNISKNIKKVNKKELLINFLILLILFALIVFSTIKLKIKRSIGVTIAGIIAIVFGLSLLYVFVPLALRDSAGLGNLVKSVMIPISFLVSGIFILRLRNWARILAIILFIQVLFYSILLGSIFIFTGIFRIFGNIKFGIMTFRFFITFFLPFFLPFLLFVLSLLFIIYFTRPKVKAQFKQGVIRQEDIPVSLPRRRSIGVTIFGWWFIIVGTLGVIELIKDQQLVIKTGGLLSFFTALIMLLAILICGIFILKLNSLARKIVILLCLIHIIAAPFYYKIASKPSNLEIVLEYALQRKQIIPEQSKIEQQKSLEEMQKIKRDFKKVLPFLLIIYFVSGISLQLIIIYFFTRPTVRAQFNPVNN